MACKTMRYIINLRVENFVRVNKRIATAVIAVIIVGNNTPPASRQISAPRGVTLFWAPKKLLQNSWGFKK